MDRALKIQKSTGAATYKWLMVFSFIIYFSSMWSQNEMNNIYKTRVLFLIDASGSMNESWKGERKWDMAVHTLSHLIDSFQLKSNNIQLGVRVLGHLYPKNAQRCDDSKLEIPFTSNLSKQYLTQKLIHIKPKGQTPLAYSLAETEKDFTAEDNTHNIVVLITDGLETCEGFPCEVSKKLKEKNICISPYIIGLGVDSLKSEQLKCIGNYIDVKDKKVFRQVISSILTDISKKTTLEVRFIDSANNPIEYFVPFSLVDFNSSKPIYNYIYSKKLAKGVDTLFINPQNVYKIIIHTNPSITIDTFRHTIGTHNIFVFKINSGTIQLTNIDRQFDNNYIVIPQDKTSIDYIKTSQKYRHLASLHSSLDVLTHPEYRINKIDVYDNSDYEFEIKNRSHLSFKTNNTIQASIFDFQWNLVYTIPTNISNPTVELLSNDYYLLYKRIDVPSEKTITLPIHLKPQMKYEYLLE